MGFPSYERKTGYDAGFITDEYGCNLEKCECLHFDQAVVGKSTSYIYESRGNLQYIGGSTLNHIEVIKLLSG